MQNFLFFISKSIYLIALYLTCNVSFRCATVTWYVLYYKIITTINLVTIQVYYNIIDYIPYAVQYITLPFLLYSKKLYLKPLYLFHSPSPLTFSPWQSPICSLYLWVCSVLYCLFICFVSYCIVNSRSIHTVANGKISSFFF